jgi:bifunctional pyridoxal-dependent enzyme with beta-cystathionase and maltose regulon repressor activities
MRQLQTIEDVYPAVEELIVELNRTTHSHLASILDHRMHQVAWSTGSELLEELQAVLREALDLQKEGMPESLVIQVQRVIQIIDEYRSGQK